MYLTQWDSIANANKHHHTVITTNATYTARTEPQHTVQVTTTLQAYNTPCKVVCIPLCWKNNQPNERSNSPSGMWCMRCWTNRIKPTQKPVVRQHWCRQSSSLALNLQRGEDKVSHQIATKYIRVDHPFMLLLNITVVNIRPYFTATMDGWLCTVAQTGESSESSLKHGDTATQLNV